MPIEPMIIVMAIEGFYWAFGRFRYGDREEMTPAGLGVTQ